MFAHSLKLFRVFILLFLGSTLSAAAADTNAITEIWHVRLDNGVSTSSAAVAPDGTIYQGTFGGRMLAISPDGQVRWKFRTGDEIKSSPAVGADGTLYFGCRNRKIYALTPAGKLKWTFATGGWVDSSPALAYDGTVYFGSWDKNFYALAPDGTLKWKFAASNLISASPAIAADGTIYFGSHDRFLYALTPDGRLKWKFLTGAEIDVSPAIASDGTVYFGSTDGNLYALRPDGSESWRIHTGCFTSSSPVLDAEGNICLLAGAEIYSCGPDAKVRWQHPIEFPVDPTPAVAANGQVYLSITWLQIGSMGPTNHWPPVWYFRMGSNLASAPSITKAGVIYACDGISLYALKPDPAAPPAKSPWPMWRADLQHTGRVQKTN
jgi:outer membrane protein assembly factor BamB